MRILRTLLGVMLICTQANEMLAQNDSLPPEISLNEIVISFNKIEERKNKIPQSIELIDAQFIARAQAQTTADLIAQNGSVLVQKSQQGGGSPIIRGFEASRILLVVDGVRMNNLIYRSGHLQNIMTVDNLCLERAEILFGPSSTQYGTDALGGTIHLFTRKPLLSTDGNLFTQVSLRSRYSTVNDESSTSVDVNLGWASFASRTILSFSQFGDLRSGRRPNPLYNGPYIQRVNYIDSDFENPGTFGIDSIIVNEHPHVQIRSGFNQYNLLQKFRFQPSEKITHQLNFQYSGSSNIPRYDRLTDISDGQLKWSEWYYGPQERLLVGYDLDLTNEGKFFDAYRFSINHQMIEESRHQRRYRNAGLQSRTEHVNVSGMSFFAQHKTAQQELQLGVDGQWNTLTSQAVETDIFNDLSSALDTRYPDGQNEMILGGVYITHLWKINEKTNLTNGVRAGFSALKSTLVDTTFFQFPFSTIQQKTPTVSGSIGLVHNPSDKLKWSLLISSGFRVPNVDDLAKIFESTPGSIIVPNNNLKPEKTITYEVGFSRIIGDLARFENSVYYTSFIDAIQTAPYSYNGSDSLLYDGELSRVLASQNSGKAYVYGFSSSLKSASFRNFILLASANYTHGRIKSGNTLTPLDHISPLMAKISLTYEKKALFAEFYSLYNGSKKLEDYSNSGEDNLNYATAQGMPAWFTFNSRIGYSINTMMNLQFGVENILDTEYRVFASGINAPGRNFYFALKLQY